MAKVVNIHLLVNSNKTAQIANRLNDALRNIVSPMGGGSAQGSFVLDYHLADLEGARPASKYVQLAIAKGRYKMGSAFQRRGVRRAYIDHYLLHINEDVEPDLMGAFGSEDAMLKAANCLHESHPDDGMYHIMRIEGGPLEILPITEEDLLYHPATEDICDAFTRGEFPLERLATSRYFTYMHEGDEVIVDASIINAIESNLQDDLVIVEGEFNQVMIPASSVKTGVSQDEWIAAVEVGKTQADFSDWRALMVSQLPRARDIFKRNGTQA